MLPLASFAAANSKEVTFDKTIKVGTTELAPGTYKVAWKVTGATAEVDFWQNKKVVASTTAKLENNRSEYDAAVQVRNVNSDSAVLQEIDFKNAQLVFSSEDTSSGN
jgi:hypothetical protein